MTKYVIKLTNWRKVKCMSYQKTTLNQITTTTIKIIEHKWESAGERGLGKNWEILHNYKVQTIN